MTDSRKVLAHADSLQVAERLPGSEPRPSGKADTFSSRASPYERVKRAADLAIGTILLIATFPLWAFIAVAIIAESGWPPLFWHERAGRWGRPFTLFKFRTLRRDYLEDAHKPALDDVHITRVGRRLRNTGLDEIPQLINIIRGQMSFVGPRPEMTRIVERYGPLEQKRLTVTPGLTGLWQVYGDHTRPIHEQIEWDLNYIRNRSLMLDVRLMAITALLPIISLFRRWNH